VSAAGALPSRPGNGWREGGVPVEVRKAPLSFSYKSVAGLAAGVPPLKVAMV
jgi:hypothetical protein